MMRFSLGLTIFHMRHLKFDSDIQPIINALIRSSEEEQKRVVLKEHLGL